MNQSGGLLAGRRALVTGAATGIGRAIAEAFAREGALVAVTDISLDGARDVAEHLGDGTRAYRLGRHRRGGDRECLPQRCRLDGRSRSACRQRGHFHDEPVADLTEEEWDSNMAVNAKGVFLSNREAVRHFLAAGEKGVIVNTASLAGKIGAPYLAHYAASKFAVIGFTQSLAREVGGHGIRVNAVCPGYVRTSMQDREVLWEGKLRNMTPEAVREEYVAATPLARLEEPEDRCGDCRLPGERSLRFSDWRGDQRSGGVLMD